MIKSKSQEQLSLNHSSETTISAGKRFDFLTVPTGSAEISETSFPATRQNSSLLREPQQQTLRLNDDHTWKTTSSKRKQNIHESNKNLQFCFGKLQSYLKPEKALEFRFKIIVAFLFLTIVLLVMVTRYFHYSLKIQQATRDQLFLYNGAKKLTFLSSDGSNLADLYFGCNIPADIKPINCKPISSDKICYDWKYRALMSVRFSRKSFNNSFDETRTTTCYHFLWKTYQKYSSLKDCFDISNAFWFGMGDVYGLQMPLNGMSVEDRPLITSHNRSSILSGSTIGRTWFSSNGVMISVPLDVPLFVSINSTKDPGKLCFESKKQYPYYTTNLKSYFAHLQYSVCLADSINTLQNYFFEKHYKQKDENGTEILPEKEPETEKMFLDRIIWSTNVDFLPNFTQQSVQSYVDRITDNGFAGIILLDSRWENSIGELKMNETVFNTPKALINILHNKGFKIMLTVSPNVDLRSEMVENSSDYILLDSYLRTPLLTRCSNNLNRLCALVNFTNPANRDRFKNMLNKQLIDSATGLGVDALHFQRMETSLLPNQVNYESNINPDQFVENMNSIVKTLPTSVGISTSVYSKNYTGYVTLYPRESSWKGLKSIIPSVLSLGLIGYPLVNTGVVGGEHLFDRIKNNTDYINKELYLRWLQVVIFLPVVQFAEPPGGNDLDVIKIAKVLLKLRSEHFVPVMKAAMVEHNRKGSPIVRPMWWGQNEMDAYTIVDQFMVGNEIVVAPIVEEGKTERDIYLPQGWWKDEILARVIRGGKWMRKYQVPLDKVAFFIKTEPSPTTN